MQFLFNKHLSHPIAFLFSFARRLKSTEKYGRTFQGDSGQDVFLESPSIFASISARWKEGGVIFLATPRWDYLRA